MEELLPSAREDTDLSKFVFRIYPTSKAIERLIALPDETFERLAHLISPVKRFLGLREDHRLHFHPDFLRRAGFL